MRQLPAEEREEGEEAPDARGDLAAEGDAAAAPDPAIEVPPPETQPSEEPASSSVAREPIPEDLGIAIDPMTAPEPGTTEVPLSEAVAQAEERRAKPLQLLHGQVPPGTYQRLSWSATELFEGVPIATPVLVVNGKLPGPTLCLTAAVHGDELNGIEMVRRVMHNLDPKELSGSVIGVPIVNLQGFRRASRYLPDRRDLNRYFPGNPQGSQASRIAFSFFTKVVTHCDALVDLHTGSFERANLPQLRADLRNPDVVTLTQGFGATVILHSEPAEGTLRHAATRAGIPTVTLEAGGPTELELQEVMHGVKGIETLLNTLGMVKEVRMWGDPEPVYYQSTWVRANSGGILLSDVSLGSTVERGDLLGTITDPMSNASTNLYSPYSGRIIGMARNQVVMPGFAAFHVGIQTAEATAAEREAPQDKQDEALKHESEESNQDYIDGMSE
ncbi:MAG TPA: succinylglutamate desuccinylase/aspartoacylase family protein [Woeseiaceae bacterium]|nr:succinylglutamate desuccinylase/aspartoacylase family protein [Woeseiaceae bacterium]